MDSKQEEKSREFALMKAEDRALALQSEQSMFLNVAKFEQAVRVAKMLSETDYIPDTFKRRVGNCMIALDLADRMRTHPIMLMQTMYVVHGRPGFEGKFLSALVNNSGRYDGKLKYEWRSEKGKPDWGCRAWAKLKDSDEIVYGPWVDWTMVVAEGWNKPKGSQKSKWETMPELMFHYRSASYFCNVHDSDLKMGMSTIEELEDMQPIELVPNRQGSYSTGEGDKPHGLYDVTHQAPPAEKPSDEKPAAPKPDETQPDPEKETAEKPDEKPPEDPSVEMALRWCKDNDPLGRYFKGKPPLRNVEIAAAALGIEFGEKDLPRVVHTQIRKRMIDANNLANPTPPEDPQPENDPGPAKDPEPENDQNTGTGEQQQIDQQQKLFGLMSYYNEATVKCETVPGFKALFRMATAYAGMSPGSRPNGIEQAEKFMSKLEELSKDLEEPAKTEEENPEISEDQIFIDLSTYIGINHPKVDFHRFKNFIGLRSGHKGIPPHYIAKNIMQDNIYEAQFLDDYNAWEQTF